MCLHKVLQQLTQPTTFQIPSCRSSCAFNYKYQHTTDKIRQTKVSSECFELHSAIMLLHHSVGGHPSIALSDTV